MSGRTSRRWIGVLCVALAASPRIAAAQDSLAAARELYTSAAYEDALAMLGRLRAEDVDVAEGKDVDVYRAFCLLALGKKADAERTIEALVSADASYRPSDADASPRLRAAFSEVRRRLLPALVQRQYAQAKAAFDRKNYQIASEEFSRTLDWLSDPDLGTAAAAPPLDDLRVLVTGFLDLSRQWAGPALRPSLLPPPPLEAPPIAEPPPNAALPAPTPPDPAPADPAPRDPLLVYTIASPNIVPPVAVRESLPPFRGRLPMPALGALEVVIDETGMVSSATMRTSVNPSYDKQILSATLGWRYKPAMLDGVPVKYRKTISVSIIPEQ